MMKLGLHTAILADLCFEEVVDYAAKTGFRSLEVCCWPKGGADRRYAGVTHIDVENLTEEKAEYYVNYAASRGVRIACLGYFPNALSDDEDTARVSITHTKKVIEAAAMMKVNLVTTFIGRNKKKTTEENIALMKEVWPPILRLAEEKGVRVAIENCPMLYTGDEWPGGNNLATTPYVWREMFRMSPNIGLCYDPSHLVLQGMTEWRPVVEFPERIFHVHLKDIQIDQEKVEEYGRFSYPSLWHRPKMPGLGEVNFPQLISRLNESGYQGDACIECEDRAFEGSLEDTKEGIELSYRYLRAYM